MKTCTVCLQEKEQEQFYHNITARDGYFNMCKACCLEYTKYRREQKRCKKKKDHQRIFYSSVKPLPPEPEHKIQIIHEKVRITFD